MLLLLSGRHVDFNWGAFGSFSSPSACCVRAACSVDRFLCSQHFFFMFCIFVFTSFDPWVMLSHHFAFKACPALLRVLSAVFAFACSHLSEFQAFVGESPP